MEQASYRVWKYIGSVLLVVAAVCANLALTRRLEPSAAPLLFAAVLIASWLGGWGPGLLATALAVVADDYFFVTQVHPLRLSWTITVRLAVFITVALVTSYLTSQREQALIAERRARLDAETANRIKDRFLAVTAHELRTPLSAISLRVDMVRQNGSPELTREGLRIIINGTEALRRLVEDLVDISRIAAGKLRIDKQPLDLVEPVRAAIDALQPQAVAKGLALEASLAVSRAPVDVDFARLRQVVTNLLTNAIKFTSKGGKVSIRLIYLDSRAQIEVQDTGRGIVAEDLPHVFEDFWQAQTGAARGRDGLGLGLSIAQELVRLHGGTIRVKSDGMGKGTIFVVELPLIMREENSPVVPTSSIQAFAKVE